MNHFPKKLQSKLSDRKANNALRQLGNQSNLIDFSSNDYLGFSKSETIFRHAYQDLVDNNMQQNGATGSRLLSGNHKLYQEVETMLSELHNSEAVVVFNSGYDANIGFLSSVPQRGDIILYDEFIHASIRDGITMSNAKAYKFKHNDLEDLMQKCRTERSGSPIETEIYIVTESVFSMDGDTPDLKAMSQICKSHNTHFVVDEAHALGVFGKQGKGVIQELKLENDVFARIVTFGKGLGCHGSAILGSTVLKQYLVNFARSFVYTTALPPHSLATINSAYTELKRTDEIEKLHQNIHFFRSEIEKLKLQQSFVKSDSAIHCCIIPGNDTVKDIAKKIQKQGFDVKPILSPTVSEGEERLRFCLHSYNSETEMSEVLKILATFVQ